MARVGRAKAAENTLVEKKVPRLRGKRKMVNPKESNNTAQNDSGNESSEVPTVRSSRKRKQSVSAIEIPEPIKKEPKRAKKQPSEAKTKAISKNSRAKQQQPVLPEKRKPKKRGALKDVNDDGIEKNEGSCVSEEKSSPVKQARFSKRNPNPVKQASVSEDDPIEDTRASVSEKDPSPVKRARVSKEHNSPAAPAQGTKRVPRRKCVSAIKFDSDSENYESDGDDFVPEELKKNVKKEESESSEEEPPSSSDESLPKSPVPKKKRPERKPVAQASKKTGSSWSSMRTPAKAQTKSPPKPRAKKQFTKIKRNISQKTNEEQKTAMKAKELQLLKLARMLFKQEKDDSLSEDTEAEIQEGSDRKSESAEADTTQEQPKVEEKKEVDIMSMLKEHEQVDEMSDSDDSESEKKVEPKPEPKETTSVPAPKPKVVKKKIQKKTAKKPANKEKAESEEQSSDEDEDGDWEVVQERDPNYKRPDNVTITLDRHDYAQGSKSLSMEQRMIRFLNKRRRITQSLLHRSHLVCLLAHQRHLNNILNNEYLRGLALSMVPISLATVKKSKKKHSQLIKEILQHYKTNFTVKSIDGVFQSKYLEKSLIHLFTEKVTCCNVVYLLGLLLLFRAAGLRSRLCLSLHTLPFRARLLRVKDDQIVQLKSQAPETEPGVADIFIEVYVSDKHCWRPVDIEEFQLFDDHHDLTPSLDQPVAYLVSIEGEAGWMKDLSPKYNSDWLNIAKKVRQDPKFFEEALSRYAPTEDTEDQVEEQKEVDDRHAQHGLPKVISEYKNHPKYALERHLLKFESFYPKEPTVLGYIRNEPVYPRECVVLLKSKDTWYREAREVLEGEEAYKVVTARPKWDRKNEVFAKGLPLEVFGYWQTKKLVPPVVKDGVIPRNQYGNVDLFHPDLLPTGAVHVKLPGLNKIAHELGVDCVPTVVGFEGIGRGLHPVIEGFAVCVEDREMLEEAWHERQREDRNKRRDRISKRAIKNWKKIIKKVVWDLRVKKKYKHKLQQEEEEQAI